MPGGIQALLRVDSRRVGPKPRITITCSASRRQTLGMCFMQKAV